MRLIDADAFDKMLIEAQSKCKKIGGNFRFGVLGNVRAILALFPTVDRPEIVRCKDCKYCGSEIKYGVKCAKCEIKHNWMPQPEWFCADVERR